MTYEDRRAIARRLIARMRMISVTGCWEWQGARTHFGHGVLSFRGRTMIASRAALVAWRGANYDDPFSALHLCDNPPCINPQHLTPGTSLDNARHMAERGRLSRGARVHNAKLTGDAVVAIRKAYQQGESPYALAAKYSVSGTTIREVVTGATWAHAGGPRSEWGVSRENNL